IRIFPGILAPSCWILYQIPSLSFAVAPGRGVSKIIEHLFENYLDIARLVRYHVDIPKKRRPRDETRQTDCGASVPDLGRPAGDHRRAQHAQAVPGVRWLQPVHPQTRGIRPSPPQPPDPPGRGPRRPLVPARPGLRPVRAPGPPHPIHPPRAGFLERTLVNGRFPAKTYLFRPIR